MEASAHTPPQPSSRITEFPLTLTARSGDQLLGHVVIDSLLRGRAHGGLRMSPGVGVPELTALARTMTLKYGYLRLPFGGAKGGVIGDPEASAGVRQDLLNRFALAIAPELQARLYVPAADMGTDALSVRSALISAGVPVASRQIRATRSGHYTAWTVLHAARQACESMGWNLTGRTAIVEGFGKVGSVLAQLLGDAGVRLVGVSTSHGGLYHPDGLDLYAVNQASALLGPRFVHQASLGTCVPSPELLSHPTELFFPCAAFESIRSTNCESVQARLVCPAANNGLSRSAEEALVARGTMVVPDFVSNCGGVLGSVLEFASLSRAEIEFMLARQVESHLPRLIAEASRQGRSLRELAEGLALERFEGMARQEEGQKRRGSWFELGMGLYQRGWVPGWLFAALARPVLRRRIEFA